MAKKIILDLCGGTGSWAKPYKDDGYKVITITLPNYDVTKFVGVLGSLVFLPQTKGGKKLQIDIKDIYGVLAAPPPAPCFLWHGLKLKHLGILKRVWQQ